MRRIIALLAGVILCTGCATQPVVWQKAGAIDLTKSAKVDVGTACTMPPEEVTFLRAETQDRLNEVLASKDSATAPYKVKVVVTRYDKGNAFARFMLIGLGQMYLYGTVEVTQGEPPVVIREGDLKANYCVGGLVGGMATMRKDVLPNVAKSIATGMKSQQVN